MIFTEWIRVPQDTPHGDFILTEVLKGCKIDKAIQRRSSSTDPAMSVFSGFLIALHELGRLDAHELAEWQAGVEQALREAVSATLPVSQPCH